MLNQVIQKIKEEVEVHQVKDDATAVNLTKEDEIVDQGPVEGIIADLDLAKDGAIVVDQEKDVEGKADPEKEDDEVLIAVEVGAEKEYDEEVDQGICLNNV